MRPSASAPSARFLFTSGLLNEPPHTLWRELRFGLRIKTGPAAASGGQDAPSSQPSRPYFATANTSMVITGSSTMAPRITHDAGRPKFMV